jgi:hypothetical protein
MMHVMACETGLQDACGALQETAIFSAINAYADEVMLFVRPFSRSLAGPSVLLPLYSP